jgi:DNA polymerase-3 subunit beta
MKFEVTRDILLDPLLAVQGVVERRQTSPILANVLLRIDAGVLSVTATDNEIELVAEAELEGVDAGDITVPAKKLVDICRTLPKDAKVSFNAQDHKALLRSGRSRFTLSTLPSDEFPATDDPINELEFEVEQSQFKRLIDLTQFAMAQQDVRYYLNGLLLEIGDGYLRAVATDGHRLAAADMTLESPLTAGTEPRQIIVPRKGVLEIQKLLSNSPEKAKMIIGANALRMSVTGAQLTSKLIDGRFPDYERVIPRHDTSDKQVVIERNQFIGCLSAVSVLSNDKYRAVRLSLDTKVLRVVANNPEQEEAEVELEVDYAGEALEIGFNVGYMIQAVNALPSEQVRLCLTDSSSSCLILAEGHDDCRYVVMPMRL